MIKNQRSPVFAQKISVLYFFERKIPLKFKVCDIDDEKHCGEKINKKQKIGTFKTTLAEILSEKNHCLFNRPLRHKARENNGTISIRASFLTRPGLQIELEIKGKHLDKKDLFGKSDPFLVFYRTEPNHHHIKVHQTNVVKNSLDPEWDSVILPVERLCSLDYDRPIYVECYDWDSNGGNDLIGVFTTTLNGMISTQTNCELINEKYKKKKKSYKNSGQIYFTKATVFEETFLEYFTAGLELNLMIALDFTVSNGNLFFPGSLHFEDEKTVSEYAQAITAVANIIAPYDSDCVFPTYTFGGMIDQKTNHCAPIHRNGSALCEGIDGVLEAYREAKKWVKLSTPTYFAPILEEGIRLGSWAGFGKYLIILIITDGVIDDMKETIQQIERASSLPISIIIVGVGDDDFRSMDELDSDGKKLTEKTERDIVQFVPFRKYSHHPTELAAVTLKEIPTQVDEFMKIRGVKPEHIRAAHHQQQQQQQQQQQPQPSSHPPF